MVARHLQVSAEERERGALERAIERARTLYRPRRSRGRPRGDERRAALLRRDGPACWICGKKPPRGVDALSWLTLDHVVPRADGGCGCADNLRLACGPCNHARGRRPTRGGHTRDACPRRGAPS